jgi:hypothetical protein
LALQSTTGEGPSSDSGVESTGDGSRTGTPTSFANNYTGILTLVNQQRVSVQYTKLVVASLMYTIWTSTRGLAFLTDSSWFYSVMSGSC